MSESSGSSERKSIDSAWLFVLKTHTNEPNCMRGGGLCIVFSSSKSVEGKNDFVTWRVGSRSLGEMRMVGGLL